MKNNSLVFIMGIILLIASVITALYQDWGHTGSLLTDALLLIILSIYIKINTEKDSLIRKQQEDLRSSKKLVDMIAEAQKEEDEEEKNNGGKKWIL